jgi:nucleoside-diphosphate-sugar epimerase
MNKILLLGGEGYIGNVVSKYFLDLGFEVTSIDNYIYGSHNYPKTLKHHNFNFIKGDIADEEILNKYIASAENIVLLAGLVGDPITKKYPEISNQINNVSINKVIDRCMKNQNCKFIFVSTCSNYGLIPEDITADEDYKLEPLSLYAKSKVNAEKYIMSYKGKTSTVATILRFATAFGVSDRMRFDLTVNQFVKSLYGNETLTVFDEHTWRPYCHVIDFARAIESVFLAEENICNFEIFNCGSDENNYTKKMILNEISKNIKSGKIVYMKNDTDPRNYRVNFQKIKSKLSFHAKYSVNFGINELINMLKDDYFNFNTRNEYGNYTIS